MRDIESKLKRFIEEKGIDHKESGQSWITDCISPSCGKERHMYIRRKDGLSKCFKCGSTWGWRELVSQIDGCRPSEAWNVLFMGQSGNSLDALDITIGEEEYEEESELSDIDEPYIELSKDFVGVEKSDRGMYYLDKRGVNDPETIVKFDLRWHEGMEAVVFPISRDGYIYGWQARKVNPKPDEPRLLTKTGFNKSKYLLNYDAVKKSDSVVLVEGPFDCIKIAQAGIGAVCSFGKEVSHRQVSLLSNLEASKVYIGLDPDAYKEAEKVMDALCLKKKVFRVLPPKGKKDFGECSSEEILQSINNAVEIVSKASNLEIIIKD